MPLLLNEPIILTQSQDIAVTNVSIYKMQDGWKARVFYSTFGTDGKSVKEESLSYEGDDFNSWWAQFTSGSFLYSQYIQKKNLAIQLPDKIEDDFKNIKVAEATPVDGEVSVDPVAR
jgi:hypothetical protein